MRLRVLPRRFYSRPTVEVARGLLGQWLVHGEMRGRITEVEAYLPFIDPAAHTHRGLRPRTRVVFGEPGHAYVYLIYGMYHCLNVVTEPVGTPGCVLIRAVEGMGGGPGKLTRAMGITLEHYGCDLLRGPIRILEGPPVEQFDVTPRIGMKVAVDAPLRFVARRLD